MKILQITVDLDGGGVDRLLYDYCSRMMPDFHFDFVVTAKSRGLLEQPLEDLGCKIYHIATIHENMKLYIQQLYDIMLHGNYDIVHVHTGYRGILALAIARKAGIPVRIAHAHICSVPETLFQKLVRVVATWIAMREATDLFACGRDAAIWMWGKRAAQNRTLIVPNAIDVSAFQFDSGVRQELREQLGLNERLVVGNVARLAPQKNHLFLLEVFSELIKRRKDAVLMLIGGGELRAELEMKVKQMGLSDNVLFLGVRSDVSRLLNAMDVFLLPSLYEGLPVTLVEVQANGLPAVVSDTVTSEIQLAPNYKVISVEKTPSEWCDEILGLDLERNADLEAVVDRYGIDAAAKRLKHWYLQRVDGLNH